MSDEFEQQITAFEAAGNEVVGRPERVSGKFVLTFLKGINSKIVFGKGCVLNTVSINVEQGNSSIFLVPQHIFEGDISLALTLQSRSVIRQL